MAQGLQPPCLTALVSDLDHWHLAPAGLSWTQGAGGGAPWLIVTMSQSSLEVSGQDQESL